MPEADPRHILFIDDNHDMASVYKKILESEGYQSSFFLDHQSALDAISSMDPLPTLVFLDFMIPGMGIHEFLDQLDDRLGLRRQDFRLIIFSSLTSDSPHLKEAVERCDGFCEKPMDIDEFLRIVKDNLNR